MGPVTLKLEHGRNFYTMHLPSKFHHPMFIRLEVNKQTNKQRNSVESIHLAPLCYAGGELFSLVVDDMQSYSRVSACRQRHHDALSIACVCVCVSVCLSLSVSL